MAALTPTSVERTIMGNKRVVLALFGAIANGDTWASGMASVSMPLTQITDAGAAADSLTVTSGASPTVVFGVAGTISGAYLMLIGT
jgi:hypothetical protein